MSRRIDELNARIRVGACDCGSSWCPVCREKPAPVLEAEPKPKRRTLAELEERQLKRADPRVEWSRRARAYLAEKPQATFGEIADHLGIGITETVAALHGLKATK
jgi:hypothetical protein